MKNIASNKILRLLREIFRKSKKISR